MGTVSNALKILDHFPGDTAGIGLTELSRRSRQNKATVYRYLCELESSAFVEQDAETRKYHVGPAVTRLAQGRKRRSGAREVIAPIVRTLSDTLDGWALLYDVTGARVAIADLFHGGRTIKADGLPCPALRTSSFGVVCFAFGHGFAPPRVLAGEITACRRTGLARTPGAENGAFATLSAPVFGGSGNLVFVVTLVPPGGGTSARPAGTCETALSLAAAACTSAIGGCAPARPGERRAE